jgi:peptidoglycan/xylan/chitin deacetylase (PgdA/CDA1 family)
MIEYQKIREPGLVLGYDWEMSEDINVAIEGFSIISNAHTTQNSPFTLFILGELLEDVEICKFVRKRLEDVNFANLVDISQHSYSHTEFKKMKPEGRPLDLKEIQDEIRKTNDLIWKEFNIRCHGLRAPQGHYKGFQNNDEILEIINGEGILYLSSDLRNKKEMFPSEWVDENNMYRQPYFYDQLKFPKLLEIPTQGWNDNALKGMSKTTKVKKHTLEEELNVHKQYLDYAILNKLVYAPLFHPWAIAKTDKSGYVIQNLITFAKEKNVKVLNYRQLYDKIIKFRE